MFDLHWFVLFRMFLTAIIEFLLNAAYSFH